MAAMPMRVALLAAECEPWAKTGGLADVVDALARALGRIPDVDGVEAPVDVFLPRYRGRARYRTGRASRRRPCCACRIRGRRRASATVTVIDVAADGYRLRLVDHPAAFDRDGFYGDAAATTPTTPGGSGCSAGRRWRRCGPTAGRWTSSTSTTGTPGRPRSSATRATRTTRSSAAAAILLTLHNLAYHGWTPRTRPRPARAARRATASSRPERRRASTCCRPGSSAPSSSTRSRRGSRAEALTPAFGMGLDGALRREGRPVHRDPQRARHDGLGPGHRRGPGRAVFARATGPARRPAGRTC